MLKEQYCSVVLDVWSDEVWSRDKSSKLKWLKEDGVLSHVTKRLMLAVWKRPDQHWWEGKTARSGWRGLLLAELLSLIWGNKRDGWWLGTSDVINHFLFQVCDKTLWGQVWGRLRRRRRRRTTMTRDVTVAAKTWRKVALVENFHFWTFEHFSQDG